RIFSRFEKLDVMFTFFILASLISDTVINVNRPLQDRIDIILSTPHSYAPSRNDVKRLFEEF
ncbi:hypothetical protein, partial [Solemya velesiana gill symbiont]